MKWLLNLFRELFSLQKSQKKESAPKVAPPLVKPAVSPPPPVAKPQVSPPQPAVKVDGRQIFNELSPIVKPLLEEMAQARWGGGVCQPDPDDLKWSIWTTNTFTFVTEHWTARIIPKSARFRVSASEVIISSLAVDEVKAALAKAAKVGPATRNLPVENILDEQI